MAVQKVLLLHGLLESKGINAVVHELFKSFPPGYPETYAAFDCRQIIISMAYVFRAMGYKVVYSGWQEDEEWIRASGVMFDHIVISDHTRLKDYSIFGGKSILNNKEKLYYISLQGMRTIRENIGDDAIVFKLRSDVTVDHREIDLNMSRLLAGAGDILIEYCDVNNMYSTPDFMLAGEVKVLEAIYDKLYQDSVNNTCVHVSSHVDHTFAYLTLQEAGLIRYIIAMTRGVHDSVVWRGMPRYLSQILPGFDEGKAFDSLFQINSALKVAQLAATIPPELRGL